MNMIKIQLVCEKIVAFGGRWQLSRAASVSDTADRDGNGIHSQKPCQESNAGHDPHPHMEIHIYMAAMTLFKVERSFCARSFSLFNCFFFAHSCNVLQFNLQLILAQLQQSAVTNLSMKPPT